MCGTNTVRQYYELTTNPSAKTEYGFKHHNFHGDFMPTTIGGARKRHFKLFESLEPSLANN